MNVSIFIFEELVSHMNILILNVIFFEDSGENLVGVMSLTGKENQGQFCGAVGSSETRQNFRCNPR